MRYRLNLAAAQWKAEKLNEILPQLLDEFEQGLLEGHLLELPAAKTWTGDLEALLAA